MIDINTNPYLEPLDVQDFTLNALSEDISYQQLISIIEGITPSTESQRDEAKDLYRYLYGENPDVPL